MNITNLKLTNFRSHEYLELDFKENLNVICGANGIGKTNIVESIYFTSLLKSYRTNDVNELIKFNADFAKIELAATAHFKIILKQRVKQCYKDDVLYKKQSEFIGFLKVIMFAPETMNMLLGSPSERRKYFDLFIILLDKSYIKTLQAYNHILKQRNDYLKQMLINHLASKDYLEVINQEYVKYACLIYQKRFEVISKLNDFTKVIFKNFFDMELDIKYDLQSGIDLNNLQTSFIAKLEKSFDRELALGTTIVGPSRDDILFFVDQVNAKNFGSKSQQRIVLVSLKLAETKYIYELLNDEAILILDDVLSELDEERQNILFTYLAKQNLQTIITTTDINEIKIKDDYNLIRLGR